MVVVPPVGEVEGGDAGGMAGQLEVVRGGHLQDPALHPPDLTGKVVAQQAGQRRFLHLPQLFWRMMNKRRWW